MNSKAADILADQTRGQREGPTGREEGEGEGKAGKGYLYKTHRI